MSDEKGILGLFQQIEAFEATIKGLEKNVADLKQKLTEKRAKYGDDISQWPKEKQ